MGFFGNIGNAIKDGASAVAGGVKTAAHYTNPITIAKAVQDGTVKGAIVSAGDFSKAKFHQFAGDPPKFSTALSNTAHGAMIAKKKIDRTGECVAQGVARGVAGVAGMGADGVRWTARQAYNNSPVILVARGVEWGAEKAFDVDVPSLKWEKPKGSFKDSWKDGVTWIDLENATTYERSVIMGAEVLTSTAVIAGATVLTGGAAGVALGTGTAVTVGTGVQVATKVPTVVKSAQFVQKVLPSVGVTGKKSALAYAGFSTPDVRADMNKASTPLLAGANLFSGKVQQIAKFVGLAGLALAALKVFNNISGADGGHNAPSKQNLHYS